MRGVPVSRPSWSYRFPPAKWRGPDEVGSFPAKPYPGIRPEGSFIVKDGLVRGLDPAADGWVCRATGETVSIEGLNLMLAYGSNGNPAKLAENLGTAIAIRCAVRDHAAVWCDARRREGSVVATLAPVPEIVEEHHVLALTDDELILVDRWEGHPNVYERQTMPAGSVLLESGAIPHEVLVYVGTERKRPRLWVNGEFWRTAEHSHDEVDARVRRLRTNVSP